MKLQELEQRLNQLEIPDSLLIRKDLNIIDCKKFVNSHLNILKANSGNKRFTPYYNRLLLFYNEIKNN